MATFTGTTVAIGGSELFAGGAFTQTVAVVGALVGMAVEVTPRTFPGNGIYWTGYVSAPDVVTVKVGATIALFVTASVYDVQVNDATTPPSISLSRFLGAIMIPSATASGTTLFAAIGQSANAPVAMGPAANVRYMLLDRACTVQRVAMYTDVGPGGVGNAASVTLKIVIQSFTPGTAAAFTNAAYTALDANISFSSLGLTVIDSSVTMFATTPLVIPANSLIAVQAVTAGGVASTAAVNVGYQMDVQF